MGINNKRIKEITSYDDKTEANRPSTWVIVLTEYSAVKTSSEHTVIGSQLSPDRRYLTSLKANWKLAEKITGSQNIITVALSRHKYYFDERQPESIPGTLIYQPCDHGTASQVYHALAYIIAVDPQARIVVLPSYRGRYGRPKPVELKLLESSLRRVQRRRSNDAQALIIMGAVANDTDAGIIADEYDKDKSANGQIDKSTVLDSHSTNSCQTSMGVIVAQASLLWNLCQQHLPFLFKRVEYVYEVISTYKDVIVGADYIQSATRYAFYYLPDFDMSKDLIERCPESFTICNFENPAVVELESARKHHKLAS